MKNSKNCLTPDKQKRRPGGKKPSPPKPFKISPGSRKK